MVGNADMQSTLKTQTNLSSNKHLEFQNQGKL